MPNSLRILSLIAVFMATACDDLIGPGGDGDERPGRLILPWTDFATWAWLDGDEVLYGTRYDYPYTTRPELRAASVASGTRTVASVTGGDDWIVPYRFAVRGAHVYFEVGVEPDHVALYRAPTDGGAAEVVLDSIPYGPAVSPDERKVAWTIPGGVVVVDIASREQDEYALPEWATSLVWAPDASALVAWVEGWSAAGNVYQLLDVATGTVATWRAPAYGEQGTFEVAWDDGQPWLYVSGGGVLRHAIPTGAMEQLTGAAGNAVGWSAERNIVALTQSECTDYSDGPFGGACLTWHTTITRIDLAGDDRRRVVDYTGGGRLFARLSPDGDWLAYEYADVSGGFGERDGVSVLRVGD
ncbi:MAG TPA: hypothetical protein VF039_15185 [Longimicrobiales bacterium]